jgi:hypothetical protein
MFIAVMKIGSPTRIASRLVIAGNDITEAYLGKLFLKNKTCKQKLLITQAMGVVQLFDYNC